MQNHGEEHWLTYAEAADLLGISPEAVRLRARRSKWPRRTPNEHGAVARVLVPDDDRGTDRPDVRPSPASTAGRPPDDRGTTAGQMDDRPAGYDLPDIARTVREAVELILVPLSEQLAKADQRYEAERARADQAEQRLNDERARATTEIRDLRRQLDVSQAAERRAHDEAERRRTELEAAWEWGLLRRLRWALSRKR